MTQAKFRILLVIAFAVAALAVTQAQGKTKKGHSAASPKAQQAVFWTKDQGDWMAVPVFPAGAQMKVIHGDPNKGAADLYIKLPPKYDTTFHWHTPVESVYVEAGQLELSMPHSSEKKTIGPGGFFQSPAKMVHRAVCVSNEDCYFYLHSSGKFDIHLVNGGGMAPAR
jgi:quercetin dioxygenase-like cupin family protein